MANKKITELTELTAANIANNDVLAIVDVGGNETKKVAISSLYDIFDNNVTIDTGKLVFGLTGANTNISALSVNTLPLIGGTVTGPVVSYSINSSSNVSIAQSLAIGYVDHRVPQANLDVKNNVYIGGATTIAGALTLGTDLAVAHGGTGASSLTDGGVLLGSGTSAITAMGVLSDGQMIVGDGSTDPVAESGATLRTSIGVGTGDTPQFYGANVTGNATINRSLAIGYTDGRVPRANLEVKGNVFISGNVAIAGATNYPEDVKAVFGSQETGPLQIFHSSGDVSKIEDLSGTSGGLRLRSSSISLRDAEDDVIIAASSTGAFLYHNGNERLKTISGGIIMSGGLGANVSGNVSVTRSLAVGYTDGRVPQANLEIKGNAYISGSVVSGGQTLQGEGDVVSLAIALG